MEAELRAFLTEMSGQVRPSAALPPEKELIAPSRRRLVGYKILSGCGGEERNLYPFR
jgi:hypothetical protein